MFYVDTSVLVAALTKEVATARTQAWLEAHSAGDLAISDWVITEVSAALSIKLRVGQPDPSARARALAVFARIGVDSFPVLKTSGVTFGTAASFADQYQFWLRAGDALHLAIAAEQGATVVMLDRRMVDPHWLLVSAHL